MNDFLNSGKTAEFERDFKKLRKEEIKRSVKTELFSMGDIEMSSVVLFESLLNSLSDTKMAFSGGEDGGNRFVLTVEKRHMGVIISWKRHQLKFALK